VNTSAADVADVPPEVDTVTATAPNPAGDVAVKLVALATVTDEAAVAPKATVDADVNPVPVTVTTVPPANGPATGAMAVTVGVEL
jgi:hypothetical protein